MPSRYIREGWLDSDRIRALGEPAEVMLLRLILVLDDYATFDGRLSVVQRRCWPAGDDEPGLPAPTTAEIEKRLQILEAKSLIFRYTVEGKPYIFVPNFQQRTRAKKPKYPLPPNYEGQASGTPLTDDGHMSGTWRTPDGRMPDNPPTHDGGPQAVSSSVSGSVISQSTSVSRNEQDPDKPVDKSAPRKVQGGLTTATPVRPQPPLVKPASGDLKPPAAMTPEERAKAGIAEPPAWLADAATRKASGEPAKPAASPKLRGRQSLERDPDAPPDDVLLAEMRRPTTTITPAARTADAKPDTDWESTPEGIDKAGAVLGMKRMPFEEDDDFATRIRARIELG
jgi:hypothetical protein